MIYPSIKELRERLLIVQTVRENLLKEKEKVLDVIDKTSLEIEAVLLLLKLGEIDEQNNGRTRQARKSSLVQV